MASLLPGFEYDIFISYRQKDNKGDQWVSKFIHALNTELDATFKEEISIYFDFNPHDGLIENHDVDKSLQSKLKAAIFIPIISQTYCDTKSFAWQHEFCAFNKLAKEDPFGRDILLSKGNVASRILPIRIHDLDPEDTALLEAELGGPLRAIDFIFKSPGVNRPLRSDEDHPQENQNKTYYRDQVNKVANAVKEIMTSLAYPPSKKDPALKFKEKPKEKTWFREVGVLSIGLIILAGLIASYFYFDFFSNDDKEEKSIAVLPFVNMSRDPEQEYLGDGISEELIDNLTQIPGLKVIGRTSSFAFKNKQEDLRVIGNKLGVKYLLEGSIRFAGNQIRITAQLIKARDGTQLWSETYKRTLDDIFKIQDEISSKVLKKMKASLLKPVVTKVISNNEVYNLLLKARFYRQSKDLVKATDIYKHILAIDSTNADAMAGIGFVHAIQGSSDEGEVAAHRALKFGDQCPEAHLLAGYFEFNKYWNWEGAEREYDHALRLDPNNTSVLNAKATLLLTLGRFQNAIELYKKSFDIDPLYSHPYHNMAIALVYLEQYDEAIEMQRKAHELLNSNDTYKIIESYILQHKFAEAKHEVGLNKDSLINEYYSSLIAARENPAGIAMRSKILEQKLNEEYPFYIASYFSWIGNTEKALRWLEICYQRKDENMLDTKSSPFFKSLHADSRFISLLKKMNLPADYSRQ